jgi:hypothetical protein
VIGTRLALLGVLAALGGCGSSPAPEQSPAASAPGDCFAAWNAGGNESNRRWVAREGFRAARVEEFVQIADFAEGAPEGERATGRAEGCSYLFHTDTRFASVSGTWEGERIRWGALPGLSGRWSSQHQAPPDNARVLADGTLGENGQARPPADLPRAVGAGLDGPPPAWLETDHGSFWLGFSSFCWKSGCADYVAPSCDDARHVPRIIVDRNEFVTAHFGFEPREVSFSYVSGPGARLPPSEEPVLRVEFEGAVVLFAAANGGGDASYAACFEFGSR